MQRKSAVATAHRPQTRIATRLVLAIVVLLALPLRAGALEGIVIRVTDGDSLIVLDDNLRRHPVRIAAIDAPERGQPYGRQAREALAVMAQNRRVVVEGMKTDRYHRRVGVVRLLHGHCPGCAPHRDLGLSLVSAGLAWHYRAYEREQGGADRARYRQAEAAARAGKSGLWSEDGAVPPWAWRQERREQSRTPR